MATILHGLQTHSLVLMGNHFHLIASTPNANISEALKRFMEMTSRRIAAKSRRTNRIWGARHYKTVLGSHHYFMNAYKYNYFNPVKAGEVERCEDYRFTTLRGLLGYDRLLIPLAEDPLLHDDPEAALRWLNQKPTNQQMLAIRSALKKVEFKHVKCPHSRKQILADDEVI